MLTSVTHYIARDTRCVMGALPVTAGLVLVLIVLALPQLAPQVF